MLLVSELRIDVFERDDDCGEDDGAGGDPHS